MAMMLMKLVFLFALISGVIYCVEGANQESSCHKCGGRCTSSCLEGETTLQQPTADCWSGNNVCCIPKEERPCYEVDGACLTKKACLNADGEEMFNTTGYCTTVRDRPRICCVSEEVCNISNSSWIHGLATCDDAMWVYADGVQIANNHMNSPTDMAYIGIPNNTNWRFPVEVHVPITAQVLGIKCEDKLITGAIRAELENGVRTNSTWLCSAVYTHGWSEPGFDDSSWEEATLIPRDHLDMFYGTGSRPSTMLGGGQWIWTSHYRIGKEDIVYCRKRLSEEVS